MQDEAAFLRAMEERPEDDSLRLAFADWLEARGDPRGELTRLLHALTRSTEVADRGALEDRLRGLVAAGVRPVGPFWANALGMQFAWVPAGTFRMGRRETEGKSLLNWPQHTVTLTRGFWLAVHEVTQASWQAVTGENPSRHKGKKRPVEQVSWDDCQEFLRALGEQDGHAYRLPTEAEWEYACRAGTTSAFFFGETISTDRANFDGTSPDNDAEGPGVSRRKTTLMGSFPPNALGLHDMHGNVAEWCQDWDAPYAAGEAVDPRGPEAGKARALRGGSYEASATWLRSAARFAMAPSVRLSLFGFRPVRTPPGPAPAADAGWGTSPP